MVTNGIFKQEQDAEKITALVNKLLNALYVPSLSGKMFSVDYERLNLFEIDYPHESVNWGDLKCREVNKTVDGYEVVIDEASPAGCTTLCAYIEKYMQAYGWDIKVRMEW
jgi:hypothetical protein